MLQALPQGIEIGPVLFFFPNAATFVKDEFERGRRGNGHSARHGIHPSNLGGEADFEVGVVVLSDIETDLLILVADHFINIREGFFVGLRVSLILLHPVQEIHAFCFQDVLSVCELGGEIVRGPHIRIHGSQRFPKDIHRTVAHLVGETSGLVFQFNP